MRRICSKLVVTENEKQKLEAELNNLKASRYLENADVPGSPEVSLKHVFASKVA